MESREKSFLDIVKACNNFPDDPAATAALYRLYLPHDGRPHGYMLPSIVQKMPWTPSFQVDHTAKTIHVLDATNGSNPSQACIAAFSTLINYCIEHNTFQVFCGQHSELYPIPGARYPVALERFAAPLFGITTRGAHLNVYTRRHGTTASKHESDLKLWIPRRSPNLKTYPNMLDNTVAGGVRFDETPLENILAEAVEEASLPPSLVRSNVQPQGTITYVKATGAGSAGEHGLIHSDVVWVFDMEVDASVVPRPGDAEVKEFSLMGIDEVAQRVKNGEFKTNSAVVVVDFLVRRGFITEAGEGEAAFREMLEGMHRKLPFPVEGV